MARVYLCDSQPTSQHSHLDRRVVFPVIEYAVLNCGKTFPASLQTSAVSRLVFSSAVSTRAKRIK